MKRNLVIVLVLFVSLSMTSKDREIIYLWDDKYPGATAEHKASVIEPHLEREVLHVNSVTCPKITVYEPEESKRNGAAVMVCPGGGFRFLVVDLEGSEIAEWLNSLGYTAFVLEYSVPNKREEAIYDGQRALRTIRHNAEKWGIDPNKLGVIGFSAGGSLCGTVSTCANTATYKPVDKIDKQPFRPNFSLIIYSGGIVSSRPENQFKYVLDNNTPPMFLFRTQDDNPTGIMKTASLLVENGTPIELHILPTGKHGYGLRKDKAAAAAEFWPKAAERWLNETLKW